jgi:hypothetical protein
MADIFDCPAGPTAPPRLRAGHGRALAVQHALVAGLTAAGLMSGCAVVSVADAAVSVAATAVKVTATVVETTVDVAASGVKAVTADGSKDTPADAAK